MTQPHTTDSPSPAPAGFVPKNWHVPTLIAAALLLMIIAYIPSISRSFLWQDARNITDNRMLLNLDGLQRIWGLVLTDGVTGYRLPSYQPLTYTLFWVEHALFGDNAVGYRVVSLALHAGCVLLVWRTLAALCVPGAAIAAALFALHPLNVQSVAWISQQGNSLSLLLALSAALLWARWAGLVRSPQASVMIPADPLRLFSLGCLLFILACCARSSAAVLPIAMMLVAWWRSSTNPPATADAGHQASSSSDTNLVARTHQPLGLGVVATWLLPLAIVGVAIAVLNARVESAQVRPVGSELQLGDTRASDTVARVQLAGRSTLTYLRLLVAPYPTMFDHPRWLTPTDAASLNDSQPGRAEPFAPEIGGSAANFLPAVIVVVLLLACVAGVVFGYRGPFVAVSLFVLLLVPAMGFYDTPTMLHSFVAEHYAYHASVPLLALLAAAGVVLLRGPGTASGAVNLLGLILIGATVMTLWQSRFYAKPSAVWTDTLNKNSRSYLASYQIGMDSLRVARRENAESAGVEQPVEKKETARRYANQAMNMFKNAQAIRPDSPEPKFAQAMVEEFVGNTSIATSIARQVVADHPEYPDSYGWLADRNERLANRSDPVNLQLLEEAFDDYRKVIELRPQSVPARTRLAALAFKSIPLQSRSEDRAGLVQTAESLFQQGIDLEPNDADNRFAYATVLAEMNKFQEATIQLLAVRKLQPWRNEVVALMGVMHLRASQIDQAEARLREAIKLDSSDATSIAYLGKTFLIQQRPIDAEAEFKKALAINPKQPTALEGMEQLRSTTQPAGGK